MLYKDVYINCQQKVVENERVNYTIGSRRVVGDVNVFAFCPVCSVRALYDGSGLWVLGKLSFMMWHSRIKM